MIGGPNWMTADHDLASHFTAHLPNSVMRSTSPGLSGRSDPAPAPWLSDVSARGTDLRI